MIIIIIIIANNITVGKIFFYKLLARIKALIYEKNDFPFPELPAGCVDMQFTPKEVGGALVWL